MYNSVVMKVGIAAGTLTTIVFQWFYGNEVKKDYPNLENIYIYINISVR